MESRKRTTKERTGDLHGPDTGDGDPETNDGSSETGDGDPEAGEWAWILRLREDTNAGSKPVSKSIREEQF